MVWLALMPLPGALAAETTQAAIAQPPSSTAALPCAPFAQADAEALFGRWNQALASGNPNAVADLYDDGALLLPTLAADSRTTPEAIRAYFRHFLARSPQGEVTSRQLILGCNQVVDASTYRFALQDPSELVEARFTFVYGFDGSSWRILHHHSSLLPA